MQALLVLTLLAAAAAGGFGLYVVAEDLGTSGEFLDGVGIVIGLGILGLAVVPFGLAAGALRTSLRQKPSAARWGIAAGLAGVVFGLPLGLLFHPVLAVLLVPALLAVIALEARPRTVASRPVDA